ncbi:MAG: HAMP domain-containing sensor histidine kinase [Phormidesmis sp.]
MSAIVSPEFISLCRDQLQMLIQQLSASAAAQSASAQASAALYIAAVAEQADDRAQSNYVPVVSYPEPVDSWVTNFARATTWANSGSAGVPLALPGTVEETASMGSEVITTDSDDYPEQYYTPHDPAPADSEAPHFGWPDVLHPEQQLVVPLVYTEVVVGLLVSVRGDRAWQTEERHHIEMVAQSLAAGCVLERRNQWLQSQLAQKRRLQSRQSEIFHNLLHQFRNPLTAISTFGRLLVKRLESDDPNQPVATGIVRESKRLRELVTHFDDAVAVGDADLATDAAIARLKPALPSLPSLPGLSRSPDSPLASPQAEGIGLGHSLTLCAQHLPDIVEPVLAVAKIVATEKGISLQSQVATDTPAVWGEEEALCEVLSNLVDNAIKYSSAGAQVWVQTGVSRIGSPARDGGKAQASGHYQGIVVGDTGPGIPPDDLARLFERNYRGIQAQSDIPGTGLGLAIAQSLMGEMQGSIEVISPAVGTPWLPVETAEGVGTVFIVWLLEVDRREGAGSSGV